MPFTLLLVLIFIILTWLSVYFFEKKNIFQTWLTPAEQRVREFIVGFLFMGLLCILSQLILSQISGLSWTISEETSLRKFLNSIALDIYSVLFEELLFRGVLLYGLIKYTTEQKGILISAAAFGIYHWYTFGVLGNVLGMSLVFLTTGFMGFVFAKAYAQTKSIILPIGLHLGWNSVNNSIFSNGPNGIIFLTPDQTVELEGYFAIISFAWYLIVPAAALLFLKTDLFDRLRLRSKNS